MTDSTYVNTTCNNCDCDCDCNSSGNGSGSDTNSGGSGTGTDTSSGGSGSDTTSGGGTDTSSGGSSTTTGGDTTTGVDTTLTSFMTAEEAHSEATPWTIVNEEIQKIEEDIKAAVTSNKFQIFVTGTTMTSPATGLPYFRVHFGLDEYLNTSYDQMNIHYQIYEVKSTFTNLDYDFEIVEDPNNPNTLMFIITW